MTTVTEASMLEQPDNIAYLVSNKDILGIKP